MAESLKDYSSESSLESLEAESSSSDTDSLTDLSTLKPYEFEPSYKPRKI